MVSAPLPPLTPRPFWRRFPFTCVWPLAFLAMHGGTSSFYGETKMEGGQFGKWATNRKRTE